MTESLRYHDCREAGEASWAEYDAQGIYLCRVCDKCRKAKLAGYRPEILSGYSQADVDEPIESDDWEREEREWCRLAGDTDDIW